MLNSMPSRRVTVRSSASIETREYCRPDAWLNHHLERAQEAGEPFAVLGWLSPSLAELLLTRNAGNRALSKTKLASYVRDIKDGNFDVNGETIIISADGLLNDGQHRCRAVVLAGKAIRTFFVFGVSRDTGATVDQGKGRTVGDILSFDGVEDGNAAAAVGSLIYQHLDGGTISRNQDQKPTRQQLRDFFEKDDNDRIQASIKFVGKKGLTALGGRAVIAFAHHTFKTTNNPKADYFIDKLITGEELKAGDPIYVCRQRLLNSRRLTVNEKAELIFRAWNAFLEGRPVKGIVILGTLPIVRA
jgi:hypothetical protein